MSTVGFVGLGAMGSRISSRLLAAGHELYGTDRTRSTAQPLIDRGLVWRDTPREVAAAAGVVFSMVTDDAAVPAITSGPGGIVAGLEHGTVYVDMSTISPQTSREVAGQVRSVGARMLDAPVSGSIPQAESGTLAIMVGGDERAFRYVEPLLDALGQTVTRIGENGQGLLLKVAINISLAVQTLAFSEGLLLADRGAVASSFFVVMYVAISLPVIGEGLLTRAIGLRVAGLTFAALVGLLSAAVLILLAHTHRRPAHVRGSTARAGSAA